MILFGNTMSQEQSFGWLRSALWPIHRNEKKMFVPLLIMLFLISFIQTILIGLKDSIVVTTSGAEAIPFIKMWAILPAALLITFIFTKLSNRYTQEIIFYLLTGGFLLFYGLFAFVIYPYRHVLNFVESAAYLDQVLPAGLRGLISIYRHWSLTGFYTICELWNTVVVSLLFWRFANEITQVSEARRFYSVLSIAYNIAVFGAGAFSAFLTYQYSEWEHVMMLSIFVIMGCGLALMGTFRWMQHVVKQPQESQRKDDTNKKPKLSLSESIAYVWKSQYLICIAVIVLAFGLVHNLVEVVWKDQIRALFPAILDYNHYLSNMQMIQGLLALVLSIGMAEGIKRLGWANVSLLTPVVMMVASLLFFGVMYFQDRLSPFFTAVLGVSPLTAAVFVGSFQICMEKACKHSVVDTTKEMAFIPLSLESKLKGKTAIDGLGARVGRSGAALIHQSLLILFTTVSASAPYVGAISILILAAWIISICTIGKREEIKSLQDHDTNLSEVI